MRAGPITLDTTLAPAELLVFRSLTGHERLGQPFFYRLEVTSSNSDLSGVDLIGQPVAIHFEHGHGVRHFHALVTDFEQGPSLEHHARYYLTLRPWLWLLAQRQDCRIFQNQTLPEIVKQVFRARGLTDFEQQLFGSYERREMVVQYGETDFNFVSRLLEEEGIYYYFRHESGKHVLVLADSQSSHASEPDCEELPYYPPDPHRRSRQEFVEAWSPARRFKPDAFTVRDYDFKHPTANLDGLRQESLYPALAGFEIFEYPGAYLDKDQGGEYARLRLEELQASAHTIAARCNAVSLLTGRVFQLTNHPSDQENGNYLVSSSQIKLRAAELASGQTNAGPTYECEFEVQPMATPFRAPRSTPKPYMRGPQTAKVVTAGADDIWADEYGRIRVKFCWDRYAPSDGTCSAWIRVAQLWAGSGWGAQFIPRVDMEVVVEFLEGDPDRPLITGCVYNGDNKLPYPISSSKTQSGIKSRSTNKGTADNFNEIRFEDKKGEEDLLFRAERSQTTLVKGSQSISVDGERSIAVTGKDSENFRNQRSVTVQLTDELTTVGKHTGNYLIGRDSIVGERDYNYVDGLKEDVVQGSYAMSASVEILAQQGDNRLRLQGTSAALTNSTALVTMDGPVMELDADSKITIQVNGTSITIDASGITLKGDKIVIEGKDVEINGSSSVKVNAAGSKVELAAGTASMSSTTIDITGSAEVKINS